MNYPSARPQTEDIYDASLSLIPTCDEQGPLLEFCEAAIVEPKILRWLHGLWARQSATVL